VVCVHGDADTVVPLDQSERYVRAAVAAGAPARLRVLPGADHFALVDPADPAWDVVRAEVLGLL
jgi:pimeloyl-ACP methyl ester carboxylesterase